MRYERNKSIQDSKKGGGRGRIGRGRVRGNGGAVTRFERSGVFAGDVQFREDRRDDGESARGVRAAQCRDGHDEGGECGADLPLYDSGVERGGGGAGGQLRDFLHI